MRSFSVALRRLSLPALALAGFTLMLPPEAEARGPACTQNYLLCLNEALDGGNPQETFDFSDEMGSIECGAAWAGCVLKRFRLG